MVNAIFNRFSKAEEPDPPKEPDDLMPNHLKEPFGQSDETVLDNPFLKMIVNVNEEGDFALAIEFDKTDGKELSTISAYVIHMMNSGQLAEYFVEALNLWTDDEFEKRQFVVEILKQWRELYTEAEKNIENELPKQQSLAVDPSEVFNFKKFKYK